MFLYSLDYTEHESRAQIVIRTIIFLYHAVVEFSILTGSEGVDSFSRTALANFGWACPKKNIAEGGEGEVICK